MGKPVRVRVSPVALLTPLPLHVRVKYMARHLKFIITIILIVLSLSLIFRQQVIADFEQEYQGYLQTYGAYRQAHSDYITTRSQYLQYKTLNSQAQALKAVTKFLISRDQIIQSYISLLRSKNKDQILVTLIDDEYNFLEVHKQRLPAVASLTDAEIISSEAEKRYLPFLISAKKITGQIILTRVTSSDQRFQLISQDIKNMLLELKANGKDIAIQERWLLDAQNKAFLAEQKLFSAKLILDSLSASQIEALNTSYMKAQFTLFEAQQYLKEALNYVTELSESIKYGNY